MMEQPQAGDIWQFDTKDHEGLQHYLFLEYQGATHSEQKWLALCLDTGEIDSVFWWHTPLYKKVA